MCTCDLLNENNLIISLRKLRLIFKIEKSIVYYSFSFSAGLIIRVIFLKTSGSSSLYRNGKLLNKTIFILIITITIFILILTVKHFTEAGPYEDTNVCR